jgi:NADH dehydrogenase
MFRTEDVVTVFGGTGFIGRYVVRRLAKTGATIRIASRNPARAKHLRTAGVVGQIVPIAVDIEDDASVAAAVAGANAVVNLIGILFESGRARFRSVQAEAPGRIARAAAAAGVGALVHISAIGADPHARAKYAQTKGEGEAAVRAAFPRAVILRPSIVFGPEDGFFNRFGRMASLLPFLPLIGGGETRFQPVYVGNVADAVMAALTTPAFAGTTYELGGPRVYSFKALLEYILAETGRKRALVNLPFGLAALQGSLLQWLPNPPLTRDQVELLKTDNVVAPGMPGLAALGIEATALETIVPTYLDKFHVGGRFGRMKGAREA